VFDQEIRKGLLCMSQRIIGSNTLVQGALPTILQYTPKSFFDDTIAVIENNAKLAFQKLRNVPGLMPVMPQGAMYMMVRVDRSRFPGFDCDRDFTQKLVKEQSVFCLPGKCFNYPNYVRIVLTVPAVLLAEACDRMMEFCTQHLVCPPPSRLVDVLVDHRSLYATYGKVHGRFLDNKADNWHTTWQLALTLAEAMNKRSNQEREEVAAVRERRESITNIYNKDILSAGIPGFPRRKGSIVSRDM